MKILITGVYGIVGSYLCNELKNNHNIIGIGRKQDYDGCDTYYSCDITEKGAIKKVLNENKDIDVIIHCAALAHNKGNDLSKEKFMNVNYEATKYFVDLANEILSLKNFIFVSTISVYGEKLKKIEYKEDDICEPKSPYAVAKKLSEEYIKSVCECNYTILRLAPVYSDTFRLNIERRALLKGLPYTVGDGKKKLSLCNIKNIYEAVNYIVENAENEKSETYNISDNKIYSYNDLLKAIGLSRKIILPRFGFSILYRLNKITLNKQFIDENSIKLITDNIYSSDKFNSKAKMKHLLK